MKSKSSSGWLPVAITAAALSYAMAAGPATPSNARPWWKGAAIYEIYPRSFQDSNGDGMGDLNGIAERLGYLQGLGVDAIWLAPIYPSPQVDFGYDISDYENVDPQYGTLADFDKLVAAAKARGIRVIMDMVMNHTSDKHPWFVESENSKTNAKRDWYIWRDGKGPGVPPNNWQSVFGHSAWTFDAKTGQWYYHKFYAGQPDLNWRNPAVEKAMFDCVRFWLDRGVAGFRLDAIPTLFEDAQLRDEKILPGTNAFGDPNLDDARTNNLPEVHDVLRDLRKAVAAYPGDRVLIGETYLNNIADLRLMYGKRHDELQLPMDMQVGFLNKLDAGVFRRRISEGESLAGDEPLFVFDNHDNARSWNRYGDGVHDAAIARLIATMLLTTRCTAVMYYGEELGMATTVPARKEDVRDPVGVTGWPKEKGRDGERTPMQWDSGKNAGFSAAASTWLPVAPDYKTVNVRVESADSDSLLNWYKRLLAMRKEIPALRDGALVMLDSANPDVLSYVRRGPPGAASIVVTMNFTARSRSVRMDLKGAGVTGVQVKTLATDAPALRNTSGAAPAALPPFAAWIGSVE